MLLSAAWYIVTSVLIVLHPFFFEDGISGKLLLYIRLFALRLYYNPILILVDLSLVAY